MKLFTTSVLCILVYTDLVAGDPKWGGGSRSSPSRSPSHSYPSPSYSHPSPSYSHPSPSYSHPSPSYSHPSPSYSHPSPSYSHPSPSYSRPSPSYSHPSPSYSRPSPAHSYPTHTGMSGNAKPSPSISGGSHAYPTSNTGLSGGSHAYPTSNTGLSGGSKPSTPFTGTPVGGHITSTNIKPTHTQPIHNTHVGTGAGSHITSTNMKPNYNQPSHIGSTAHGYPASNGGLSGHATSSNVRPMQNQPYHGTPIGGGQHGYPASGGLSGNAHQPNTGHYNPQHIQPTHQQPSYNQPMYHQPTYGHAPVYHAVPVVPVTYGHAGPIYTTSPIGYHPTFVTSHTYSSGSDLNSMLTGLAVYNALRSGHSHDHYYHHYGGYGGYGGYDRGYSSSHSSNVNNYYYGNSESNPNPNQGPPSSQGRPNAGNTAAALGISNCTLALSNSNGTDTITIPCEIASSFVAQNTSTAPNTPAAPLPAATSDTKLNCTIAVVKNNGLTEFTQIPCDMIRNMAPKPEPAPLRLNCTQGEPGSGSHYGYTPCTIVPSTEDTFPLGVIPLEVNPVAPAETAAAAPAAPAVAEIPAGPTGKPITVETPKLLLGVSEMPPPAPAA